MSKYTIKITYNPDANIPYEEEIVISPANASTYSNQNVYSKSIEVDGQLGVSIGGTKSTKIFDDLKYFFSPTVKHVFGYQDNSLSKIIAKNGATVSFEQNFYGAQSTEAIIEGSILDTSQAEYIDISTITMQGKSTFIFTPKTKFNLSSAFVETANFNPGVKMPFQVASQLPVLLMFLDSYKKNEMTASELAKTLKRDLSVSSTYICQNYEEFNKAFNKGEFDVNEFKNFCESDNFSRDTSLVGWLPEDVSLADVFTYI